jgi:hypothetical protein
MNNNKVKFVSVKTEKNIGTKMIQVSNTFHKEVNGTPVLIKPAEMRTMYNTLKKNMETKYGNCKIMIRGLNAIQWFTFKGMNDDDLNVQDYDSYFINNIKYADHAPVLDFSQLEFTVIRNKETINNKA